MERSDSSLRYSIFLVRHSIALNDENSSERYVFIGFNLDSSDEDDDEDGEFSIYASCFVGEL